VARCRDDFEFYAENCLQILTKAGHMVPLRLNRPQRYLHERLQAQYEATGKVRALVLKGRQQGACLAPDTKVLTAGLEWVAIDDLEVGQELIATDEETSSRAPGTPGAGRGRVMRTATVEAIVRTRKQSYRVTLDDGRSVVCSGEHRWLIRKSQTQWAWRSIDGGKGGIRVGDKMRSVTEPWGSPSLDDAWFGGVIDGEGSMDRSKSRKGIRLAVSQRAGAVLSRMERHCSARGYGHYIISDDGPRKTKYGRDAVHAVNVSSMSVMFRLIGLSRPERFIGTRWWEGKSMPHGERTIVSIEPVGEIDVVDIQTSTGTFIAEGIVSHNSTYLQARFRWRIKHRRGVKAYVLAHEQDASDNLFVMAKRYHDNEPKKVRPSVGAANAKELWFNKLDSRYSVATAGSKEVGRSGTAQYMHASEAAFWPHAEAHWAGIGQTVPDEPGTEVIAETTANGVGNEFHKRWLRAESGRSDYIAIFIPWFWSEEYATPTPDDFVMTDAEETLAQHHGLSPEQIYWRRRKIENDFNGDETKFWQEYPSTAAEAFVTTGRDTLCKVEHIMAARKAQNVVARGPLVVGVDPARMGSDRTAIVWRRGRVVTRIKTYEKRTTMQVAGIVANLIDQDQPAAVFIDIVGLGVGVYDRLEERGFGDIIVPVQAGEKASDEDRYRNKRAEMWDRMAKWLEQGPVQIPDADEVQTDLMCPGYTYDSHQRLVLESKEQILKDPDRRSPDIGDALAMTFAEPVRVKKPKVPKGAAWGVIDELIGV
jgi:hypothetical protein